MTATPSPSRPDGLEQGGTAPRWAAPLLALAAVLVVIAAYSNHFGNRFTLDDEHVVVENLALRSPGNVPAFLADARTFSAEPDHASYRPLVSASLAVDRALGGGAPAWYRVSQLALLLACGALLFVVSRAVLDAGGPPPAVSACALLGSVLFCVHAANTEAVNLVSARSELLSALAVLAAFAAYLRSRRARRWHVHVLPAAAGVLAGPAALAYGPLLFAHALLVERRPDGPSARSRVPGALSAAAPALVATGAAALARGALAVDLQGAGEPSLLARAATEPFAWLHHARLFVVPLGLTAVTDWPVLERWAGDSRLFAGVVFAFLLVGAVGLWGRRRETAVIAFGLAWFVVCGLTPRGLPRASPLAEHRAFLPFAGLVVATTAAALAGLRALARRHPGRRRELAALATTLAVGLVGAHALATHARNAAWATERALWADVASKRPSSGRGLLHHALRLAPDDPGRPGMLRAALRRAPDERFPEPLLALGHEALLEPELAERSFRAGVARRPRDVSLRLEHARFLLAGRDGPAALEQLRAAHAASPHHATAGERLMEVLAALDERGELGRVAKSRLAWWPADPVASAHAAGRLPVHPEEPTGRAWHALAFEQLQAGRHAAGAASLHRAVALEPTARAWADLGWAYRKLGFLERARIAYERALALNPDNAGARSGHDDVVTKLR